MKPIPLHHVESSSLIVKEDLDQHLVKEIYERYSGAKWRGTMNLTASILGSAILAMPHACNNAGILFFIIFNTAAAYIAHSTAVFLVRTIRFLNPRGEPEDTLSSSILQEKARYPGLAKQIFGSIGERLVQLGLVLSLFGACIGHTLVVGDIFTPLFGYWFPRIGFSRILIENLFVWALIFPICAFNKNLSNLRFASAGAVLSIGFFSFTIIVCSLYILSGPVERRDEILSTGLLSANLEGPHFFPVDFYGLFRSIPLILYAYDMHFNAVPIHEDMKVDIFPPFNSVEAFTESSWDSFTLACMITAVSGLAGYLIFLNITQPDILLNFAVGGSSIATVMNFVRGLYGIGIALTFPMLFWELRRVNFVWIYGTDHVSNFDFVFLTWLIFVLVCICASMMENIATIFGLAGSTIIPLLDFVLPSLLYIKSGAHGKTNDKLFAILIGLGGLLMIPIGLGIWTIDRLDSQSVRSEISQNN